MTEFNLPSQNHYFFANLDDDPEPEVISIRGYEDGSNAFVADINLSAQTIDPLFYFDPMIGYDDNYHWGYAWYIEQPIVNADKKLLVALSSDVIRDKEIVMTEKQINMPAIIFTANDSFEPFIEVELSDLQYLSIQEIEAFSKGAK